MPNSASILEEVGYTLGPVEDCESLTRFSRENGRRSLERIYASLQGCAGLAIDFLGPFYEGILAAPPEIEPIPFEIIFETPHLAPLTLQVEALLAAQRTILKEYRQLISFAQNI